MAASCARCAPGQASCPGYPKRHRRPAVDGYQGGTAIEPMAATAAPAHGLPKLGSGRQTRLSETLHAWQSMGFLDNRAGEPAEEGPDDVSPVEEMAAEDKHDEQDEGEDDGQGGPGLDVELVVGRVLGAHVGKIWSCGTLVNSGDLIDQREMKFRED